MDISVESSHGREKKRRGDGKEHSLSLVIGKDTNPIGSGLHPYCLPVTIVTSIKTLCPIIVTLRIEILTYEFWIYTSFHSINITTMSE